MKPTLAMDEGDLVCLLLDPDLSLARGRECGPESAVLIVGNWAKGNKLSPGLADRERRGQAIFCLRKSHQFKDDEQNVLLSLRLSYR
jgi:hypothetical protein